MSKKYKTDRAFIDALRRCLGKDPLYSRVLPGSSGVCELDTSELIRKLWRRE